jgi:hypothetical protein
MNNFMTAVFALLSVANCNQLGEQASVQNEEGEERCGGGDYWYKPQSKCYPKCGQSNTDCGQCSDRCDIVLAGGATEVYASSCIDVPYDPLASSGPNHLPYNDDMLPFMSVRMQECVLDQELAIGQYGSKKLAATDAFNQREKRHGYPGGWVADWVSENFISNNGPTPSYVTNPSNYINGENANREFVDISFPCEIEVE